jgi:hypothetical protein
MLPYTRITISLLQEAKHLSHRERYVSYCQFCAVLKLLRLVETCQNLCKPLITARRLCRWGTPFPKYLKSAAILAVSGCGQAQFLY